MVDILMDPVAVGFRRVEPRYGGYSRNFYGMKPWENLVRGLIGPREFISSLTKNELFDLENVIFFFEDSPEYDKLREDAIDEFGESMRYYY